MLSLDKIYQAAFTLKNVIRPTNLISAPGLSNNCEVYLKPENLQITGSFKVRGSAFKISQLSDEEKAKGVIACSAGNHAQGVALAATKQGIKSIICLPNTAPISKVEATKNYGAEVCLVKGVYDDAYKKALELKEEHGYSFVHPFDDEDVIAGQGTIGLEILEELDDVDAVVVPIGGGGLISGVAFAVKAQEFENAVGEMIELKIHGNDMLEKKLLTGAIIRSTNDEGTYIVGGRLLEDDKDIADYVKKQMGME